MTKKHKKSTIISEGQEHPDSSSRHYVDNKQFYQALLDRRKQVEEAEASGEEKPPVSEYIGRCIYQIAYNASRRYNFQTNAHYRDELCSDAILKCIKKIDKFNPYEDKKNPFSYFSQMCFYAFLDRIAIEETNTYISFRSSMDAINNTETADMTREDAQAIGDNLGYTQEYVEEKIDKFEKKRKIGRYKKRGRRSKAKTTENDGIDSHLE